MADMTLEEALEAATVDEELISPVNEVLMINPETRTINVPNSEKMFGVRQDMSVERKYFKCPRIVGDNIDLSQHRIFVNYVPSKQDGTYNLEDDVQGYWCKDLAVEGDFITFSWEISENVTRNAGYIAFAVYAKTIDEYGNLKTKWHTTIAIGNVLDTLPDGEEWVTVYPDIVMQLLERMDEVEKNGGNGTSDAVQYIEQTLTEEQQIQARTNIGAASANEVSKLSEDITYLKENGIGGGTGWTKAQIDLLDEIGNYLPFTSADGGKKWDDLITSLRGGASEEPDEPDNPEVTLTSISATYNGGEVATGTALTDLTGITVTATYSDGTTKEITGYTLSGDIVEGENEIAVSYGGLTTTFTVVGVAESGGEVTAELITDGLEDYFDFRTCVYNNTASGGATTISPTQGSGQLYAWSNNCVETQDEYGMHAANTREWLYDKNGGTNQTDLGTEFTIINLGYGSVGCNVMRTVVSPKWSFKPKYINTSNSAIDAAQITGDKLNNDSLSDYNFTVCRVSGSVLTQIMDSSVATYDGNDIDDFVSWVATVYGSVAQGSDNGVYSTAFAVYNRALSDVEIEEMRAFMKTLEVA